MSFCSWLSGEKYADHFEKGLYACSQCGNELFHSSSKFRHSSPWPAFDNLIRPDSIIRRPESATVFKILCSRCGAGLGHEFLGEGPTKGTSRF